MKEPSPNVLELYDLAALGSDASTVLRVLGRVFSERKEEIMRQMANAKAEDFSKLSGRLSEWLDLEQTFRLQQAEGQEALKVLKGGRA